MRIVISFLLLFMAELAVAQSLTIVDTLLPAHQSEPVSRSYGNQPVVVNLDETGKRYIRFINWNQLCLLIEKNKTGRTTVSPQLKRVRFLTYAQLTDRLMILTHFGVNNISSASLHPTGQSSEIKLFLHDAWTEYEVWKEHLSLGAGLHYYNGLSRISNASTLNFVTSDNYRQAWAQLGLSDQFGRHIGLFAKGRWKKLNYHVAINDAIVNSLDTESFEGETSSTAYVARKFFPDEASRVYQGYVDYQFLDAESNKLPYRTGTYLGTKKVFNFGVGFFAHPNGIVRIDADSTVSLQDVQHFAADIYYDSPLHNGGAISLYGVYYRFNYGTDYCYKKLYGTGDSFYAQLGYLMPSFSKTLSVLPFMAYSTRNYNLYYKSGNTYNVGMNVLLNGHNTKLTMEYRSTQALYDETKPRRDNQFIVQTTIAL